MGSQLATKKKPIIHAYVKRGRHGRFNLYTQTGNALPVYDSQHDSFSDASREAAKMGANSCLLVQPNGAVV